MTLPASALPVEAPPAFLGVAQSVTGKLWRDRLDARGAARALAIVQRYQLPEMLARVLAGRDVGIEAVEDFLDPTIRKLIPDSYTVTQQAAAAKRLGMSVVVIDHHQCGDELPEVDALVNPNRLDDLSGLGHLAAVGLVLVTLVAVNRELRERGFWTGEMPEPDLLGMLHHVALGTV